MRVGRQQQVAGLPSVPAAAEGRFSEDAAWSSREAVDKSDRCLGGDSAARVDGPVLAAAWLASCDANNHINLTRLGWLRMVG